MPGKTLDLESIITPDNLAVQIANTYMKWDGARSKKKRQWKEVRDYIFATDTTTTSNSKLPWKNKTTTPKLTQIRDNLYANYRAALFPKRRWLNYAPYSQDDLEKKDKIRRYMYFVTQSPRFKKEMDKLIQDYIDHGNAIAMPEWVDDRVIGEDGQTKVGYVGPVIRRISPYDIVFNPLAPSFEESPKILRKLVTLGELKEELEQLSLSPDDKEAAEAAFNYMMDARATVAAHTGTWSEKNEGLQVDGFGSFQQYLESGYVEVLTFYGDLYDTYNNMFMKNYKIVVIDRHKVIYKEQLDGYSGMPKIHHVGWRTRQDNLWAMGPLDNLVGMQYRLDHIENLKADVFDLIAFPVLKVKGYVEDFEWKPFGRIYTSEEGDVETLSPEAQALNANLELSALEQKMEEMAGAPKEALGFRTPGEKTAYEVQRLENASSRIFMVKSVNFEENMTEPLMNDCLELARQMSETIQINYTDPEFGADLFDEITPEDISGSGVIRPIAARHFAERAEILQNMTNFFNSAMGQDEQVRSHISSIGIAKMFEDIADIKDYNIVQENVRIGEMAEAQRLMNSQEEQIGMEAMTPSGLTPDDFDEDVSLLDSEIEDEEEQLDTGVEEDEG